MDPTHDFCAVDAGRNESLLVFSHRGAKGFGLYRLLEEYPLNRLFVRDPNSGWYNGRVGGLGQHPEEIASSLARQLAAFPPGWTGAIGSSMGGYAAVLYGCLLSLDSVLAFSPQTLLDPIYPLSPDASLPCSIPDLVPVVARSPRTRLQLICGEDDIVDLFYAGRLAAFPNVEVLTVSQADHLIMAWLHERGALTDAIREWVAGRTAPIFHRAEVLDDHAIAGWIAEAVPAFHRGEYVSAASALAPIVSAKPNWVGAQCMFGRALVKSGDPIRAEAVLRSAIELSPSLPEPPRYLARALMSQKKLDDALHYLARSVELLPEWAEAYYDIGDCHAMAGNEQDAKLAFVKAAELKPSWQMPRKRLAELGVFETPTGDEGPR